MSTTDHLKRTQLHALHASLGAKLVPFGGYEMPVHYRDGIVAEHRAVRERVGVFDISHMGEFEVTGPDRNAFVQRITCNDVAALKPGQAQYTALLTERGTFVDDCVVYRFADRLMLVVNAANIARDWENVVDHKAGANVRLRDVSEETGLLAVQGPGAEALLAPLTSAAIALLPYYHFTEGKVAGMECFISRTGYTGEDGFELYCRGADLEKLWHALVGPGRAEPCGLGARDTLRLEAGYPLYGSDIDDTVTPFEAGLGWIVKLEKGADFVGLAALRRQKAAGVTQRLVGFRVLEPRLVARPGHDVYVDDRKVGVVRSGTVTPTANCAVGMTYLPIDRARPGTRFTIDIRGRHAPAEVVPLPFVPRRTRRPVAAG
jgi:aminomethyltransferase